LFLSYYRRGFIPGPNETQESFSQRIASLVQNHESIAAVEKIYGVAPDWIPMFFSSKKLLPWEAGCAWIDDKLVQIQLHPKRKKSQHKEILAHEIVHAVRSKFDEPRFEEILAYRTSSSLLRRFLGPIFQKPVETWLFLLAALIDIVQLFLGTWFFCVTLLISVVFGGRLIWNQWRFSSCMKNIPDSRLVLGLTDREIVLVAKGMSFSNLDDGTLRWQMIKSFVAALLEEKENCGI